MPCNQPEQAPKTRDSRPYTMRSAAVIPRSPGTHIVGPWVIDRINLYRGTRIGTQYIGNWASRG